MSIKAEKALIGLLTDPESVDTLLRQGLNTDILPTEELRPVVTWCMDYHTASGKAPTPMVIKDRYGDLLADMEVSVDEVPDESIEWALEALTYTYGKKVSNEITRSMAKAVAASDPETILEVLAEHAAILGAAVQDLTPHTTRVDLRERGEQIVSRHDRMAEDSDAVRGITFGLREIDEHIGGVRPGEVAILAGTPKAGKSITMSYLALKDWERGRVPCLYTLENDIEMTEMRIACQALHLSYRDLERGTLPESDREDLIEWVADVLMAADNPMHIIKPSPGQRSATSLMQQARALGADSVFVDQLTFVEAERSVYKRDIPKHYEIAETMRRFKDHAGHGRYPMPLVVAHQVNREGVKMAQKTGRLMAENMADGSDVERTADMVFALYASDDQRAHNSMQLQTLAARRFEPVTWDLHWQIHLGHLGVQHVATAEDMGL